MPKTAPLPMILLFAALACGGREREPTTPDPASKSAVTASPEPSATSNPERVRVRLLAFNDFHGYLMPPTQKLPKSDTPVGGAAYFAAHMKRLATGHPNTLIVSAGDLIGASPLSSGLFHDEPTIDAMNTIGLTATTIGNHELDEGIAELERLKRGGCHPKDGCKFEDPFRGARFDYLAANMTVKTSKRSPLPAYVVREVAGVPIALVGMPLEDTPSSVLPEGVAGLAFSDEAQAANALVPELRAKGIETVILLIHEGGESKSTGLDECSNLTGPIVRIIEKLDPAYDAIVSGHTHQLYNCKVAGRPVTSAASFGRVITTIDLEIDPKTKNVIKTETHNHAVTHDVEPDAAVQAIVDRAVSAASSVENRVIGRITETLTGNRRDGQEATLALVVADAHLEATKKAGAQIALVGAGGVRADLVYAKSGDEKEDGLVTYGEAFAAQPFGNDLFTLTVSGAQLAKTIEYQLRGSGLYVSDGVVIHWNRDATVPPKLSLYGKPIAATDSIRITTNAYIANTDPTLAQITDRTHGIGDLEALEQYFAKHKVVHRPKAPRLLP